MLTAIPCTLMRGGTSKGGMEVEGSGENLSMRRSALLRAARKLMEGSILVPGRVWAKATGSAA